MRRQGVHALFGAGVQRRAPQRVIVNGHLHSKYQEMLLSDMAIFKAELFRILKQKRHFGDCLPWLLAGVCHGDSSIGRRISREFVAAFDVANAGEEHHHRIA